MDRKMNNKRNTADIENVTTEKMWASRSMFTGVPCATKDCCLPAEAYGTFNGAMLSTQVVPPATKHAIFFTAAASSADIPGEQYTQPVKLTPSS